jgi:gelsolin
MKEQNTGGQKAFWDALGAAEEEAQVDDTNDEDDDSTTADEEPAREHRLLRLHSGMLGRLKLDVVAEGKISKDMFDSKDVFILDVSHEIFVWVGRDASRKERRHGLQYAQDYLKESGLPPFTPICTLLEGGEDELFEAQLEGWQGW